MLGQTQVKIRVSGSAAETSYILWLAVWDRLSGLSMWQIRPWLPWQH